MLNCESTFDWELRTAAMFDAALEFVVGDGNDWDAIDDVDALFNAWLIIPNDWLNRLFVALPIRFFWFIVGDDSDEALKFLKFNI